MRTLRELQQEVHAWLRQSGSGAPTPAGLAEGVPSDRLETYARFVRRHIQTVLDKDFPTLKRVISLDVWQKLSQAYYESTPSTHYELNEAGRGFPHFIAEHYLAFGLTPAHQELAELEWLEWEAFASGEPLPGQEDTDGQSEFARGRRIRLNPTLALFESKYAVDALMRDPHAGPENVPTEAGMSRILAVFRNDRHVAKIIAVDDGLMFAIKCAADAHTGETAATAAGMGEAEIIPILERAAGLGLVFFV